ncbi:MAG: 50S ribosomal protein L22 [Proteobacteria bacterium]|jgi:large subunit ribosomal protein L22|nr:50S ribosomal protein L22 [Pseudomonadota bacterium]
MSKKNAPRRVGENEARAFSRSIRVSPRKLNLMAQLIRGKSAEAALAELTFNKRRIAIEVKTVLESAIANAENNHQLDVDQLYVAQAYVGKSIVMKRWSPRARGRVGHITKPFSNLTIVVREKRETA